MKHLTLKELPVSEQPYEKCEKYGVCSLSDAELLAVIIRSGSKRERSVEVAERILGLSKDLPGLYGLNYLTLTDFMQVNGIGRVKGIQLLCITELAKRMAKQKYSRTTTFSSPDIISDYYMQDMRHLEYEQVILVLLDTKCHKINDFVISKGTVNASLLEPREIFVTALRNKAVHIILLHNHPSGDPTPSREDMLTTKRILDAGALIGIDLLDHIIIGNNCYMSFREEGML